MQRPSPDAKRPYSSYWRQLGETIAAIFVVAVLGNYPWELAQAPLYVGMESFRAVWWDCLGSADVVCAPRGTGLWGNVDDGARDQRRHRVDRGASPGAMDVHRPDATRAWAGYRCSACRGVD